MQINKFEYKIYPVLPTGCEATACTMFINYLNKTNFSKEQIAEKLTKESEPHYDKEINQMVGGNPHRAFVGDPFSSSSFGVFHEPIFNFLKSEYPNLDLIDFTNDGSETSLKTHLQNGNPVIAWITLELKEPKVTDTWRDEKEREKEIEWKSPEHCVLVVGYDQNNFIVNDPHTGKIEPYITKENYFCYAGDRWGVRQLVC